MTLDRSLASDDRGVSEVIGYVLVVSLVITTVGVVSVSGIGVLQDAREAERIENAKRAFDLLADNMEDIYREGAPSRSTEIQLGSAQLVAQQTTDINVSWVNSSGVRLNRSFSLSSVTYRGSSERRLVYDGGAVFRFSNPDSNGTVLRRPPFVINKNRVVLAVPVITTDSTSAVVGSTALIRTGWEGETVLERDTQYSNIRINVTSPYWRAWRTSLEEYRNVDCIDSDAGSERISCVLLNNNSPEIFFLTETRIRLDLTR
jgi:hypothetical protein